MNTKKKSIKQERRLAKTHNLKQVPASGAVRFGGKDFNSMDGTQAWESKATDADFFQLKAADLAKLHRVASFGNRTPIFIIQFPSCNAYFTTTLDSPDSIIEQKSFKLSQLTVQKTLETGGSLVIQFKDGVPWKLLNSPPSS